MSLANRSEFFGCFIEESSIFAEVEELAKHAVLKLAVDGRNLGLCDSRDYYSVNFDY